MNWYRNLIKIASPYGYWLAPTGQLTPVDWYDHRNVAKNLLKTRHNLPPESYTQDEYGKLGELGYIRIVADPMLHIDTSSSNVTTSQIKTIRKLIEDNQYNVININNKELTDIKYLEVLLKQPKQLATI